MSFEALGYDRIDCRFAPAQLSALLEAVGRTRRFDASLFLTEAEYEADPVHRGTNPRPGRNLAEALDALIAPLEADDALTGALRRVLGPGHKVMDRKFVVGMPHSEIPVWLRARIENNNVNNLGAYIRPEYRDMTYFWGIDLHQDLIDWSAREADFITVYVYLEDVGPGDAPLYLLPRSHRLGADIFPHELTLLDKAQGRSRYTAHGDAIEENTVRLTGPAGAVHYWHACLLHGTQPTAGDRRRISLRYLIEMDPDAHDCALARLNASIPYPLSIDQTRRDLAASGVAVMKGNFVNTQAGQSGLSSV
ncbi:phytanoyl-CoA dioxygenase family protein [Alkalicaulis satelles]|uniref:Phytanoyl-CoA dioxygenase family protein n=1 Tax=Alkalicaulis satelles TaxID=2609175 RepID=A0A5M6ZMG6_9PROT|nr:phytanoyl-CoA dioxygenase family protein [Alkalicaulis satelles]KAA5804887.1 phytanoyl-CoA dioxygenase family protein [Alkalicaulis satelles]